MILSHILQFWKPYYGGAEGGSQFIGHRSRLQLQKSPFFSYKMLCRSIQRPSGAPPCMPKLAPPFFAPLHHRPSHSLKNVGIFQNSVEPFKFTIYQELPAPPRAPPCFMVVKFKIRAQTFHIIIFHENAFLLMYRPNRLFEIRSFTMLFELSNLTWERKIN